MVLLTLLATAAIAIVGQRSLFGVVILSGIYSFLMASVLIVYDAVDVALTEASVGAGISVVVLLATLHLTKTTESVPLHRNLVPLFVAIATAAALVWGTLALPPFGVAEAPIHQHVAPRYLGDAIKETGVPNVVTAVLADYRGYDTLGEVTVIFTAGIGVMLLLHGRRRRERREDGKSK
jgi:multicomponent Na+:H+ antiporter subunit B